MRTVLSDYGRVAAGALVGAVTAALFAKGILGGPAEQPDPAERVAVNDYLEPVPANAPTATPPTAGAPTLTSTKAGPATTTTTTTTKASKTTTTTARAASPPPVDSPTQPPPVVPTTTTTADDPTTTTTERCGLLFCG